MDDARLLDAELDGAALGVLDRLRDVRRHGADLWVRHQAAGAQHLTETPHQSHHVRRGDDAVEIHEAALDALHQIFRAHHIGAGGESFVSLARTGEHGDADVLAGACGQVADASDLLVSVARVDAQIDRDLDAFVELRLGVGLHRLHSLVEAVQLVGVHRPGLDALCNIRHGPTPPPSDPSTAQTP